MSGASFVIFSAKIFDDANGGGVLQVQGHVHKKLC